MNAVTLLHMGSLHTVEWILTLALILGPFLALGVTIVVVRRRDALDGDDSTPATPLATPVRPTSRGVS